LPGLDPRASLEDLIIVCISVTNVRNNSKLDSARQWELFGIAYPVRSLGIVSRSVKTQMQ
jgi:hypothetical protein